MQTYSSAAYRSFKTFIGELTAVAAGVYVGIQEVVPLIEGFDSKDPWKVAAQKHGVIVDAIKSKQVVQSSVRLNLVSLYSGFDHVDRTKSPERNRNALIGWLRTEHGVSVERAERILKAHMTHELDG